MSGVVAISLIGQGNFENFGLDNQAELFLFFEILDLFRNNIRIALYSDFLNFISFRNQSR